MHQQQQHLDVPQPVLEWLVKVLQPIYSNSKRTFVDVVETLSQFNNLKLRTRVFTKESGSSELLLCLYGVLEGVGILIWVPKEYPAMAPYVQIDFDALKGRRIQINQHLDSDGVFYLPIFSSWDPKHSSILKVVNNLLTVNRMNFPIQETKDIREPTCRPKLPAHPPAPTVPTLPALPALPPKVLAQSDHPAGSSQSPLLPPKPPRGSEGKGLRNTTVENNEKSLEALHISLRTRESGSTLSDKAYIRAKEQSPSCSVPEDPVDMLPNFVDEEAPLSQEDKSHTNALGRLQLVVDELADTYIAKHRSQWEQQRTAIKDITAQLRAIYGHELNTLHQLQDALDSNAKLLDEEITKIQQEIEKARLFAEKSLDKEFKINNCIVAETVALNQFYELVAKDHALTDAIHLLNRLLNKGVLSVDVFVKKTRHLAREQFLARTHMKKISQLLE